MDFKIHSKDTLSLINLHDCVCDKLCYEGNQFIFDMAWMEILASHPANPFEKAHQSDAGRIIFVSPALIEGKLISWNSQEEKHITALEEITYSNFTILDFLEEKKEDIYQAYLYADSSEADCFIELSFRYLHSEIMWNHLNAESWFEDKKWKKS